MTPRYIAWIKTEKRMFFSDDILAIDYENEEIVTQQVYFENGLPDDRDIYCYKTDEIELMQTTGLKDKNGKEIFEGDIVKMAKDVYSEPTYYEVVRHRGGAYRLESKQHGCELWLRHTDCEVVGNIYENKELLDA
ncbi:YopX family protein [Streptococcus mitis]|uniref:YopX family protein n=1 Tax=Streptococcus mitis TaxID=28037 RepID=UPI00205FBFD8|nr:YopX family protein [Streptococcus mitis]DAO59419.1 MAG TPA: YopX protein [Caudoviricetes sp.]